MRTPPSAIFISFVRANLPESCDDQRFPEERVHIIPLPTQLRMHSRLKTVRTSVALSVRSPLRPHIVALRRIYRLSNFRV